ncbi:iron-siderophore ABC transporter substrate-binding protein [Rhizobium sp. G187]|uniref:iron-siderophore ABC transporter substrate-binding protein n=1 Tax=Rhizobium sp. G187 TaxID=3451352 RepID=UPI003EE4E61A
MSADMPNVSRVIPNLNRRQALLGLAACLAAPGFSWAGTSSPRIVCLDYGLASTAIGLGVTPVGIASMADWDKWVVEPALAPDIADIGSSWEVNFEIVSALKPDLILNTPFGGMLTARLEQIAPVLTLGAYAADGGDVLPKAVAVTRQLGKALGRVQEAEALVDGAEALFAGCRARLAALDVPPLVLATFMDQRHVQVYSAPGLFTNVLDRIGIKNAWPRTSSFWGFETVPLERLARVTDPRAKLIALEPFAEDIGQSLDRSGLWHALPFARPGQFAVLPGSLMFGMLNDAMRFARILSAHLEETLS